MANENLLVIGRPGSGKTTVAIWKAQRFIEQTKLEDFQRVLFLSFSNAAVERIVDAAKGKGGLPRDVRRYLRVSTFHALCVDILRPHAHLAGVAHPFKTLAPHQRQILMARFPKELSLEERRSRADEHFLRLEREQGRASFERFAPLTCEILKRHPDLREAYSHRHPLIIVDEYQDTDDSQDELMRLIGQNSSLICFGDNNQQIYDWRPDVSKTRFGISKINMATRELSWKRLTIAAREPGCSSTPELCYPESLCLLRLLCRFEGTPREGAQIASFGSVRCGEHSGSSIRLPRSRSGTSGASHQ